jgi:glycosyltransferase involved in cell wall biosynthesis
VSGRSIALVQAPEPRAGDDVADRLGDLLDHGWDAHVLCVGGDPARVLDLDAVPPDVQRLRIHPPPLLLRKNAPRPGLVQGALRAVARHPSVATKALWGARGSLERYLWAVLLSLGPELLDLASIEMSRRYRPIVSALRARAVVGVRAEEADALALDAPHLRRHVTTAAAVRVESAGAAEVVRELGVDERLIALIPPAYPNTTTPAPVARDDGIFRILSVGPLTWEHGYEYALHAVALLADRGVTCRYRIVGRRGEFAPAVAFAREQLGIERLVEIVEPTADGQLADEIAWADVLLSAAVAGPVSGSVFQHAQAAGLPAVRTEPPSSAADGALTAPRRDAETLAERLAELANDDAFRRRVVDEARLATGATMTVAERHARFRALYDRVLRDD